MRQMYHFGRDQDDTLQERLADMRAAHELAAIEQQIRANEDQDLQNKVQQAFDQAVAQQRERGDR